MPNPKVKTAYFVVTAEYFRAIASGKKTSEFRQASPFWIDRLDDDVGEAVFQLGYGGGGKPPPRMRFRVAGLKIHDTINDKAIPYPKSTKEIPKGFRSCLFEVKLGKRLE